MTTAAESALLAILVAIETGDTAAVDGEVARARAMYEEGGPLNFQARIEVEAKLWCQLLLDEIYAKSAWARVQDSAELYLELGLLDLDKILDALKVDEAEWHARVERNRERREENRLAAARAAS
ncbi:MAG: hypothetical protein AB7O29_05700 [Acidimicrobiia bacterium]